MTENSNIAIEAELKTAWQNDEVEKLSALSKRKDVQEWLKQHCQLREMTAQDSAELHDTLKKHEMVHPVDDITTRMAPSKTSPANGEVYKKHAYGLFLPWDNTRPVCAVYTAWVNNDAETDKLPNQITQLKAMDPNETAADPRYLVFYSISNMSKGIGKVGPMLLEGIVAAINGKQPNADIPENPNIEMTTLSPLRSEFRTGDFLDWVRWELDNRQNVQLFTGEEIGEIRRLAGKTPREWLRELLPLEKGDDVQAKAEAINSLSPEQKALFDEIRTDLALDYFVRAKDNDASRLKPKSKKEGQPQYAYDLVEHFHLGNGAFVGNISFQEDNTELTNAGGVMVNYYYGNDDEARGKRSQAYKKEGAIHLTPELQARYDNRRADIEAHIPVPTKVSLAARPTIDVIESKGVGREGGAA